MIMRVRKRPLQNNSSLAPPLSKKVYIREELELKKIHAKVIQHMTQRLQKEVDKYNKTDELIVSGDLNAKN